MADITLNQHEWTQIASGTGNDDVEVRAQSGQFHASIGCPSEASATSRVIAATPIPFASNMWARSQVAAGVAVYAKAVGGPAVATVTAIVR